MNELRLANYENVYDDTEYPKVNLSSGIIRLVLLNNCNYKCPHCFKEGEHTHENNINSVDFLLRIVRRGYNNFGIRKVKLTGGEPLLYPYLSELLEGIREIGINDIDITTNGSMLLSKIDVLTKYRVNKITVTLNTLDKDLYKSLHKCKENDYQRVFEGLEALKNIDFIDVSLNTVVLDIKNQGVMDVIKYAWDNGYTPRLCEPMHINNVLTTQEKTMFATLYKELESKSIKIIKSKCMSVSTIYLANNKKAVMLKNLCDRRLCDSCGKYMYIRVTSEGKLKPCLSREDTEVQIYKEYSDDMIDACFIYAINNMGNGLKNDMNDGFRI